MRNIVQDLRFAVRTLAKTPGYTATVILTLAIGICANATVFTWIRSVLGNPLPGVPRAERLVTIETLTPSRETIDNSFPDYRDFRDQSKLLAGMFAFKERPLSLGLGRDSTIVWSMMVTGNYFEALGLQPATGRFFSAEEQKETPGGAPVVVLGYRFWEQRFGRNAAVVGQRIRLNKQEFTVVGVAPRGFQGTIGGLRFDVYVPLMMMRALTGNDRWIENRGSRPLYLMARMRDGVTLEQGRAEIATIAQRLAREYPDSNKDHGATLLPIAEATRGAQSVLGTPLRILMGVAGVVLLIVCANVANLQLARATRRHRELSVRRALGASRARVGAMLLTESLMLAAGGGIAGVVLSLWSVEFLRVLFPEQYLPIYLSLETDWAVLLFVALLCVLTAVLAGLAPVLQTSRASQAELLASGRNAGAAAGSNRTRSALVMAEISLAMVALVCAGMLYRSYQNARQANPGFEPNGVLIAGLNLSAGGYDREQGLVFLKRVQERLSGMPGIAGTALAEDVPLGFDGGSWEDIEVDGYVPGPNENMKIYRNLVTPGYLDLMKIPLRAGRDFTERDDRQAPFVVIVNESFVNRFFAGRDPINRKVRGWGRDLTVIGVAADSKYSSLRETHKPYMYMTLPQFYRADIGLALHVRAASGDTRNLIPVVRGEIQALDGAVLSSVIVPLVEYMSAAYVTEQTGAMVLSVLGGVALVLAVLGLFSVMAYTVVQRTAEIGIRLALGAPPAQIRRMMLRQGVVIAGIGVAIGVAQFLGGVLYGVLPVDAPSLLGASALLLVVGSAAAYFPAIRASRVDPLVALRYE